METQLTLEAKGEKEIESSIRERKNPNRRKTF